MFKITKFTITCLIYGILFTSICFAEELSGKVIGVTDGDTIKLLVNGHDQVKIRLAEIDAPEKKQPFGTQSKKSLSDLIYNKDVIVSTSKKDRYNRTIGTIFYKNSNINSEQVRRGMAWVYRQYNKDPNLLEIENSARISKIGLWIDPNPVPPWEWRRKKKGNRAVK